MLSFLRCLLGCSLALLLLGGCRKPRNTGKGYWEGKGTAKEVVIKECRLRSIQLKSGKFAYSLGLPVFGIMYYSQWYTL